MKWYIVFLALVLTTATSCKKENSGSSIPEISFVGLNNNTISQSGEDTIYIVFRVIDGDANLGIDEPTGSDIFLKDSRDTVVQEMEFPEIPSELQDAGKGINALCTLSLDSRYFTLREDDTARVRDTMNLDIYIQDKAFNKSNHIITPDIYITL